MIGVSDLQKLGSQFLAALEAQGLNVRTFRPTPKYPVGGAVTLTSNLAGNLYRPELVQVLSWESGDGTSKAVTIVAAARVGELTAGVGAYCKVRYGDERGSLFAWLPVPGIMTVVAKSISVQAQLAGTPFRLLLSGAGSTIVPPFIAPGTAAQNTTITVLARDESPSDDPAIAHLRNNTQLAAPPITPVAGPVFVETLELNNESAAPVGVIWGEGDGSVIPVTQMGSVIVPANGSVGVARSMLGAVATNFVVFPVASLTAAAGGAPTISASAASITANVSGFYIPTI